MADPLRLFAALPVPAELLETLAALQRALDRRFPPRAVRWTRRDQLHLTLRFYGNAPADQAPALVEALQRACAGTAPLELELAGVGAFPSARRPRVIWAGLRGETVRLLELERRIELATAKFGDHQEKREFQPHLTLGRIGPKDPRGLVMTHEQWTEVGARLTGRWTAAAVHLVRSQLAPDGARYSDLACIAFAPAAAALPGAQERTGA
jgi:RNA 2',3'-cyclic 3'-phosphodiesterase